MTWKNEYAIGVQEIDLQHKALCDAIDNLMDACKTGKGRNEIVSTINFLFDYTKRHFKDEEAIQQKCGYPKTKEHKAMHEEFIVKLTGIKDDIIKNGINISSVSQVNMLITNWLINHIKKVDKEIAQYIK